MIWYKWYGTRDRYSAHTAIGRPVHNRTMRLLASWTPPQEVSRPMNREQSRVTDKAWGGGSPYSPVPTLFHEGGSRRTSMFPRASPETARIGDVCCTYPNSGMFRCAEILKTESGRKCAACFVTISIHVIHVSQKNIIIGLISRTT